MVFLNYKLYLDVKYYKIGLKIDKKTNVKISVIARTELVHPSEVDGKWGVWPRVVSIIEEEQGEIRLKESIRCIS